MPKKVTEHGKIRVKERVDSNAKVASLRHQVLKSGKGLYSYTGKFFQYLMSKENDRFRIKVYQDNLYIFTKNSRRMITTYPIPDKYLPVSNYEIPAAVLKMINIIHFYGHKSIHITLRDGQVYSGIVEDRPHYPRDSIILITRDGRVKIYGKDVARVVSYYGDEFYVKDKVLS